MSLHTLIVDMIAWAAVATLVSVIASLTPTARLWPRYVCYVSGASTVGLWVSALTLYKAETAVGWIPLPTPVDFIRYLLEVIVIFFAAPIVVLGTSAGAAVGYALARRKSGSWHMRSFVIIAFSVHVFAAFSSARYRDILFRVGCLFPHGFDFVGIPDVLLLGFETVGAAAVVFAAVVSTLTHRALAPAA